MDDVINLLQNDPLVFIIAAIAIVSLFSLFIFAIYFNLIPAKIASQYRQIRERPLLYFGLLGLILSLILVFIAYLFVPGFADLFSQKTEMKEVKVNYIQVYAAVIEVDEKNNTLQVKDSTTGTIYQVVIDETTGITKENKSASLSQIGLGEPVTVKTKKIPEQGNTIFAVEIILVPTVIVPGGQEVKESEGAQQ